MNSSRLVRLFAAASAIAATSGAGCVGSLQNPERFRDGGGGGDGTAPGACRLSIDVERDIFGMRCATAGCHTGAAPAQGLDLTPPGVYARIASQHSMRCSTRAIVDPANPSGSVMAGVLTAMPPCMIPQMPLGGMPLSADEVGCVQAWIASMGASTGGDGGSDGGGGMDATPPPDGGGDAAMPPPDMGASMVFLENGGTVVLEAENADENIMRGGISWMRSTTNAGFSGAGSMAAMPNNMVNNNTGYVTMSPQLRFRVDFRTTGTYQVWGRGFGATTDDDSFHAGVDNTAPMSATRIGPYWAMGVTPAWLWNNGTMDMTRATIDIGTAGVHTIEIWMREDGFDLDKIILTTDMAMMPSDTGPAESPRGAPR